MDKIIDIKKYICASEELDFSAMYRQCSLGTKTLPVKVYMLEHRRQGHILIDTGCSRLLRNNPLTFARMLSRSRLSFGLSDDICTRLTEEKKDPLIIRKVLLTHCHPECCGALPLLPKYELISTPQVLAVLRNADSRQDGIMKQTLPPPEIKRRAAGIYEGETILREYFKWVYDVFNDGSILAVDLNGHSRGMAGYYIPEKQIFFAADASIDETAVNEPLIPTKKLLSLQYDPDMYLSVLVTLRRIHKEHPEIKFLFSHSV